MSAYKNAWKALQPYKVKLKDIKYIFYRFKKYGYEDAKASRVMQRCGLRTYVDDNTRYLVHKDMQLSNHIREYSTGTGYYRSYPYKGYIINRG